MQSVWFLFWWCPLLSVDCFHKLCLSGTPSENSQAGWDLGNRMARGYRFDAKWVCPMGSYAWGIQVFCSVQEMRRHLISRTEHLNTSGITFHGTDSFHVKPITPGHPISKITLYITTNKSSFIFSCYDLLESRPPFCNFFSFSSSKVNKMVDFCYEKVYVMT